MGKQRMFALTVALALVFESILVSAAQTIPYAQALDAASISVERLDDIVESALLVGNGDINALVYTDSGNVEIVLTKNDVWDARLDTTLDPPLPTLKRIKELGRGTWPDRGQVLPEGVTWEGPDSYHANPYPCPRACARLILGTRRKQGRWRGIRAQGRHNEWESRDGDAVMSIEGNPGVSNGWRCESMAFSTDDYDKMRLTLSGSTNAQYYVDVMDLWGHVIFATKWQQAPVETTTRLFSLPAGKQVDSVILYTQTGDGKRAENRFERMQFEGRKGTFPVKLNVATLPTTRARLDLHRAVAQIDGVSGGPPRAAIRALAQRNVFLVEADVAARLEQFQTADTPDAKTGQTDGVRWLHQTIPGDLDWPGMEFAVAVADVGQRKAVTIVTSLESNDVVAAAVKEAQAVVQANAARLVRDHEAIWTRFWAASGLDVDDELMEQMWYRGLYFLRCVSKPGVVAPGLFASLTTGSPAWHGDYHTNYNIQQTFWHCYAANHPELAEPYDRLIRGYFPRARWLARTIFDMSGAFYPHVLYAYEPRDPSKVKSPVGRQYIHHVWGFTLGVSGFTVQPLWWHYKYEPDRHFLEQTAYPAVRDVAILYAEFIDQCERQDGRVVLAPSVSPEHWGWTANFERNRNCTFDIAMARYTLKAAIEGATTLQRDPELVTRFRRALALLPDYPRTQTEAPVVVDVEGAPPINYNIVVPTTPVFPCDVVTWQSSAGQRELFSRTIESIQWNGNNSMVMLGVARARLDMPGTLDWMREEVKARLRPNGTLTLNRLGARFNSFGHYTEQFGATMVLSELLLQSVDDVIRVFPAWPRQQDARFQHLRTQGGFLVSSSLVAGKIDSVEVESTVGGPLRLVSPWKEIAVRPSPGSPSRPLTPDAQGIVQVSTRPGDRLIFEARGN
jgi:Glycosyl hydrolase family 95 catalytic domain